MLPAGYDTRGAGPGPGALPELRERQDVAVGVGEPCHHVTAWCRPHAAVVLVHAVVAQEHDTLGRQVTDGGRDVGDAPAQDGVAAAGDVGYRCHPEHGAVRVEDTGEVILPGQGQ